MGHPVGQWFNNHWFQVLIKMLVCLLAYLNTVLNPRNLSYLKPLYLTLYVGLSSFLGYVNDRVKRTPTQPVIVSSYFVQMGLGTKPMCKRKTVRYLRHNGRGLLVSTGQPQYIPISRNRPPFIDSAIHSLTDLIPLLTIVLMTMVLIIILNLPVLRR